MTSAPLSIPLTDEQLRTIGETCAIFGQIDLFMQDAVMWLLSVPALVAGSIVGSTDARARAEVWGGIVENKCRNTSTKALAKEAIKRFKAISEKRNDFVHAFFGTSERASIPGQGIPMGMYPAYILTGRPGTGIPFAIKTRNRAHRDLADIMTLRDEAAETAALFFRIANATYFEWRGQYASHGKP